MNHTIDIKFILTIGIFVLLSFIFHELAHYIMGTLLGYDMTMTLNTVTLSEGSYAHDWERQLVSAAGPIFTIITAGIFFYVLRKKDNKYVYILLFIAFIQRFLAAAISLFNPNDEARISESLGIGKMTLPILVSLLLFGLVYKMASTYKYHWKFNLINYFIISFFITVLVFTDQTIIKPLVYN
ncbi:hypothetical protein [uncultured Dokdonia sp.]|uniref:hypothetical protein n=1 Tax=uncultured Dokdonia sp. TaxID=575653 RepID=UPI002634DD80|nr:hypothetical protein [uncultured Dokdonia sp.]